MRKVIFGIAFFVSATVANADVRVALEIIPPQVLAGAPAQFDVVISNDSDEAVTVPNRFTFRVTDDAHGESFNAENSAHGDEHNALDTGTVVTIPPRGSRRVAFRTRETAADNTVFEDPRLALPGTYTIRAILLSGVSSEPTRFTVVEPSGVDRQAYTYMLGLSGGTWSAAQWLVFRNKLAVDLPMQFPSSAYVGYVLPNLPVATASEAVAAIRDFMSVHPTHPHNDELLLYTAWLYDESAILQITSNRNLEKALGDAAEARRIVDQILEQVTNAAIRQAALQLKGKIITDDLLRQKYNGILEIESSPKGGVTPLVECVRLRENDSMVVKFGYENTLDHPVTIPFGSDNQVTPSPRDRDQPRFFKVGKQSSVFEVEAPGAEIVWHLNGSQARALRQASPICSE